MTLRSSGLLPCAFDERAGVGARPATDVDAEVNAGGAVVVPGGT